MKSVSVDIPVHDIAPLLEIREYSIVWFLVLAVCMAALSFVVLKRMLLRGNSKEVNERQQHCESLMHIDMTDSKKAAYAISKEGSFFAQDNQQMQRAYKTLFDYLEPYKYAPKVEPMDEECLALYEAYCRMIVV